MPRLTPIAVVDILIVALLIYQFLQIVRGRRAAHILTGIVIMALVYVGAIFLHLELLRAVLAYVTPYAPFAFIVVFQSEIRRLLSRIGRRRLFSLGRLQRREFVDELVLALKQLSEEKTGALVVLERDVGLRTFIESGIMLDAYLSRDLLLAIFQRGSALHDGAVIVQKDRVAAAACFLPLSVRPMLAHKMGTRHRAAIGVTEESDCLSLIVSEETGKISAAAFGEIEMDITPKRLAERITEHIVNRRSAHTHRALSIPTVEGTVPRHARQDSGIE
jgi:diadenylate cyclase